MCHPSMTYATTCQNDLPLAGIWQQYIEFYAIYYCVEGL